VHRQKGTHTHTHHTHTHTHTRTHTHTHTQHTHRNTHTRLVEAHAVDVEGHVTQHDVTHKSHGQWDQLTCWYALGLEEPKGCQHVHARACENLEGKEVFAKSLAFPMPKKRLDILVPASYATDFSSVAS